MHIMHGRPMVATPTNYERLRLSYTIAGMIGAVVQRSKTVCRQTEDPQDV